MRCCTALACQLSAWSLNRSLRTQICLIMVHHPSAVLDCIHLCSRVLEPRCYQSRNKARPAIPGLNHPGLPDFLVLLDNLLL